jgi:carbonic anhydrase
MTDVSSRIHGMLSNIFDDNDQYCKSIGEEFFADMMHIQSPRATILTCSDSRVHADAYDNTPFNDLFMIRNIGNQVITADGSLHYGIDFLETPLAIVMGHSGCGAVQAALSDYSDQHELVKREIRSIKIDQKHMNDLCSAIIDNVHYQVNLILKEYHEKIANGNLVVMGSVFDFRNDYGHGYGKVIIVSFNGERDPDKIRENEYIRNIKNVSIGVKKLG